LPEPAGPQGDSWSHIDVLKRALHCLSKHENEHDNDNDNDNDNDKDQCAAVKDCSEKT